jgi:hypothetical protein
MSDIKVDKVTLIVSTLAAILVGALTSGGTLLAGRQANDNERKLLAEQITAQRVESRRTIRQEVYAGFVNTLEDVAEEHNELKRECERKRVTPCEQAAATSIQRRYRQGVNSIHQYGSLEVIAAVKDLAAVLPDPGDAKQFVERKIVPRDYEVAYASLRKTMCVDTRIDSAQTC